VLQAVNEEVKRTLKKVSLAASIELLNMDSRFHEQLMKALLSGDEESIQGYLKEYLDSMSYLDAAGKEGERFYHGLCLGLLGLFFSSHRVVSNREGGKGRFDLALFPHDTSQGQGLLLELKVAPHAKALKATAQAAREQIDQLDYAKEFGARGIQHVTRLGIAFYKKEVAVAGGR